jgi:hypothetical protein
VRPRPGWRLSLPLRVFDYINGAVPVLRRMFDNRLKGYGYGKGELPDGFEMLAEPEYDEGGWDVHLEMPRSAMMSEPPRRG